MKAASLSAWLRALVAAGVAVDARDLAEAHLATVTGKDQP